MKNTKTERHEHKSENNYSNQNKILHVINLEFKFIWLNSIFTL